MVRHAVTNSNRINQIRVIVCDYVIEDTPSETSEKINVSSTIKRSENDLIVDNIRMVRFTPPLTLYIFIKIDCTLIITI